MTYEIPRLGEQLIQAGVSGLGNVSVAVRTDT